jgi:hypothetical protein
VPENIGYWFCRHSVSEVNVDELRIGGPSPFVEGVVEFRDVARLPLIKDKARVIFSCTTIRYKGPVERRQLPLYAFYHLVPMRV